MILLSLRAMHQERVTGLRWQLDRFEDLSPSVIYACLRLRQQVFVVEQECVYLDADGLDPQCLHLIGWREESPVAYLRLVPPEVHSSGLPSLGRICTALSVRGLGLGRELVARGLQIVAERYPGLPCHIGAQSRLLGFYESFGFQVVGAEYIEDGIPHLPMRRPAAEGYR